MDYKSSLEDIDEVTKQLTVSIPADEVAREIDSALGEVASSAKIKGFRPGKAPRNMIEQLHGNRVRMEVAHRLISSSMQVLVQEHKLEMVGEPEIDISSFEPGKEIEYTANISLFPKPQISGYEKFSVEAVRRPVADSDVDDILTRLREAKGTLRKLEFRNAAQAGDIIDASLVVQLEGEEASPPEPLVIALGEGNLPEELEQGLLGLEIGQTRDIEGVMPQDHQEENLRGKTCSYTVTLNALSEKVLPEVDDDFAKTSELEVETLLELRMKIREQLEIESENDARGDAQAKILDELIQVNEFLVPQILVDDEIRHLLIRNGLIDPQKMDPQKVPVEAFREQLGEVAVKRVKTAIMVDRIAEQDNLRASEAELTEAMQKVADANNLPLAEVQKYFHDASRRVPFELEQTRGKVLEFLFDRASVKYVNPPPPAEKQEDQESGEEPTAENKKRAKAKSKSAAKSANP